MTRAIPLLLLLAAPASAWELGRWAGVEERAAELDKRWRPYSKTMVDLDIVKKSLQEEEPDWVTDEKSKMTPRERPFGRIAGFALRQRDVRFLMVGRHAPVAPADAKGVVKSLREAEAAASQLLFETMAKDAGYGWELSSSAPGRDALSLAAEDGSAPKKVVWHYLDFYRETGRAGELYILFYADKPRVDLPPEPPAAPKASDEKAPMRFFKQGR